MRAMKKKTIAMVAVATTVSVVGVGAADAASKKSVVKTTTVAATTRPSIGGMMNQMGGGNIASVLASLVTKGTITQAQSDAITAALNAARPAIGANGQAGPGGDNDGDFGMGMGMGGALGVDKQNVILTTLGIDAATLQAGRQAGKSLATIAGTKTQALIDALVAAETKAIDAAVTAGKLTSAQATTAKAGLVAHVTAEVNQTPPAGMGMGMMGGRGHGGRGFGAPSGTPGSTPNTNGNN